MMSRPGSKSIIGLTGTCGSGKSTVGKLMKKFGAQVVSSDKIAAEVFKKGNPIYRRIQKLFGVTGLLRKPQVAAEVFANSKKRKALERIAHPYVFRRLREEIARAKKRVIVLEIPLLFETGADKKCCVTIAVVSDLKTIIKRLRKKGFSKKEILARINAQLSQREKKSRADFIIRNAGSFEQLKKQTQAVWRKIVRSANS